MDTPVVWANMVELILRVAKILNERHIFVIVDLETDFGVSEFGELDGLLEETDSSLFKGDSTDPLVIYFLYHNHFSSHGDLLLLCVGCKVFF